MVLFLFINLGIVLFERVIFLYNSKSTKKTKNKSNSKRHSKGDLPELEEKYHEEVVQEEEKQGAPIRNSYGMPARISYGPTSFNTLQMSPINNVESRRNFSPIKEIISSQKELDIYKKATEKKKQKKERVFFYGIFIKYAFNFMLLILFCYFTLILMPTGSTNNFPKRCEQVNGEIQCFLSMTNDYLLGFYFLYCMYFLVSGLQIKYINILFRKTRLLYNFSLLIKFI